MLSCWLHTNARTHVVPHCTVTANDLWVMLACCVPVCAVEMLEERLDRHPPLDLAGNQPQMDLSVEPPDVEELVKLVTMATEMLASRTGYSYVERCERGSGGKREGQLGERGRGSGGTWEEQWGEVIPKLSLYHSWYIEKTMQVPIL